MRANTCRLPDLIGLGVRVIGPEDGQLCVIVSIVSNCEMCGTYLFPRVTSFNTIFSNAGNLARTSIGQLHKLLHSLNRT